MAEYYYLEGKKAVPVYSIEEWARRYDRDKKRVALDAIGEAKISTVFLGLNHAWSPNEPPLLFETMVFGGSLDQEMERYTTWDEAELGHKAMVEKVKIADKL